VALALRTSRPSPSATADDVPLSEPVAYWGGRKVSAGRGTFHLWSFAPPSSISRG
jgi:hypothetical protein